MSHRFIMRSTALLLAAALSAGCTQDTTDPDSQSSQVPPLPTGLATLEWHEQARNLVAANRLSPLAAGRVYAALGVAQNRAIKALDASVPPGPAGPLSHAHTDIVAIASRTSVPGGRAQFEARRGAVAGASSRVLSWFFPAAAGALGEKLAEQGNASPGDVHPHFTRGVAIGQLTGDAMIQHLQNDGFTAPWTGTVPTGPGIWVPAALPPAGVMLGSARPYFLTSGSQFRPAAPPAVGSVVFNTDLNEVLTRTQNRTAQELDFAKFWDFPTGSPTPLGFWNSTVATYVAQNDLDELAATRVFALTHAAMFDALIGCWDAKYHYWYFRPTQANPAIALAFPVPNHPSYPSGHSCASAAGARVLERFFPERTTELANFVSDAGLSRILAGIHYRFDVTAGQTLGRSVADWAITRSEF